MDVTSLKLFKPLVFKTPSVYPRSSMLRETDEVSGKGLRKIKIVLAFGVEIQAPSRVLPDSFSFGRSERVAFTYNAFTRADRTGSPWGPGSRGRRGLVSTTRPMSWLGDHLYPQILAPSHPAPSPSEECSRAG